MTFQIWVKITKNDEKLRNLDLKHINSTLLFNWNVLKIWDHSFVVCTLQFVWKTIRNSFRHVDFFARELALVVSHSWDDMDFP